MLKARIARKKRALRAASVQKARKACNSDGDLSEGEENVWLNNAKVDLITPNKRHYTNQEIEFYRICLLDVLYVL